MLHSNFELMPAGAGREDRNEIYQRFERRRQSI